MVYVHELHTGSLYRVHPRKAFIREFVKSLYKKLSL